MRRCSKIKWSRLSINVPTLISEELGSLLVELGAYGVEETIVMPKELPPLNRHLGYKEIQDINKSTNVMLDAYFKELDQSDLKKIVEKIKLLQISTHDRLKLQIQHKIIEDKDWNEEWKRGFNPIRVGKHLVVSPSWQKQEDKPNEVVIYIDPGLAFGTGHHSTTASCLKLLEREIEKDKNYSLLDVGTGSGILAITAAKLGVEKIIAMDIDKDATVVAKKNAVSNKVSKKIIFSNKPLENIKGKFSLIVANILLQTVIGYSSQFKKLLAPSGRCIIAGILDHQRDDLLKEYVQKNSFKLIAEELDGEWIAFVFEREQI